MGNWGRFEEKESQWIIFSVENPYEGHGLTLAPIGGLGGYLFAGGKYIEALGTEEDDKYGFLNCLNGLRTLNNGKLIGEPDLGHLIHRISLETKIQIINKFL